MTNDNDVTTNILSQIADTLEEHNRVLIAHESSLEKLFGVVAEVEKKVEELKTADDLNSSDAQFIVGVSARLKAVAAELRSKRS